MQRITTNDAEGLGFTFQSIAWWIGRVGEEVGIVERNVRWRCDSGKPNELRVQQDRVEDFQNRNWRWRSIAARERPKRCRLCSRMRAAVPSGS